MWIRGKRKPDQANHKSAVKYAWRNSLVVSKEVFLKVWSLVITFAYAPHISSCLNHDVNLQNIHHLFHLHPPRAPPLHCRVTSTHILRSHILPEYTLYAIVA
jgi:hypothetical protein